MKPAPVYLSGTCAVSVCMDGFWTTCGHADPDELWQMTKFHASHTDSIQHADTENMN